MGVILPANRLLNEDLIRFCDPYHFLYDPTPLTIPPAEQEEDSTTPTKINPKTRRWSEGNTRTDHLKDAAAPKHSSFVRNALTEGADVCGPRSVEPRLGTDLRLGACVSSNVQH